MRVLITGAAGFIGSHLLERLQKEHLVLGCDNFLTGHNEHPATGNVDITDRGSFYGLANSLQPDLIVHCAASYSDPDLWHRDIDTNITGAVNVAAVAKHHGARVVYFQTVLPPTSSYAISKLAAEHYLRLAGVPLLVVRLANIYGPRNLSGPIPTFTRKLLNSEVCTIAHTQRDFVYIDTLVDAMAERITKTFADMPGWWEHMTVHSGRQTHIRTIYELVAAELDLSDVAAFEEVPAANDDVPLIDWNGAVPFPDCSLAHGIGETVAWYREHGIGDTYTHLRVGT